MSDYKSTLEEFIYGGSHWVTMNMNDTFYYSSGDCENIEIDDIKPILPICEKFGTYNTMRAYASIKRKMLPLKPYRNKEFIGAMRAVKKLYKEEKYFMVEEKLNRDEL